MGTRFATSGARLIDGLGTVSAVGAGINPNYKHLLAGSRCLEDAGIHLQGLATSSFRVSWLVPRERLNEAVRALHALYLGS